MGNGLVTTERRSGPGLRRTTERTLAGAAFVGPDLHVPSLSPPVSICSARRRVEHHLAIGEALTARSVPRLDGAWTGLQEFPVDQVSRHHIFDGEPERLEHGDLVARGSAPLRPRDDLADLGHD